MPTGIAYCPLGRVLTYKNLIYLLNLKFNMFCLNSFSDLPLT